MQKIWLKQYPADVPAEIRTDVYPSLVALIDESFRKYRDKPAYRFMGRAFSFGEIDDASRAMAAWLQGQGLVRGDRVDAQRAAVPGGGGGHPAGRAGGGQRQPALHPA